MAGVSQEVSPVHLESIDQSINQSITLMEPQGISKELCNSSNGSEEQRNTQGRRPKDWSSDDSKRRTNIYSNSIPVRLDNKQRRNWLKDTLMLKVYTMELIKMKSCFSKMRNFSRGLQKLHHLRASWGLELFQMFLSMEELTIKLRLLINRLSISQIIRLLINLKWQEIRVDPLLAIQMPNSPMWDLMVNRRRQHVS